MLTPKEIAIETCNIGENKVKRKSMVLLISAILAGMYIGFGFYGFIVVSSGFGNTNYSILGTLLGAMIFPVGLILIIITGTDLFTGNCLIFFGLFNKKYRFYQVIKNLVIVYFGNLIGALFLVVLIYFSKLPDNENIKNFIIAVAQKKTNLDFIEGLTRGILCNILVVLAVYMSFAAKTVSGKVISAMLPILLFVLSGYEHSIANMFILPLGYLLQSSNDISFLGILSNLAVVTLGNFIGGAIFIPLSYYFIYLKNK